MKRLFLILLVALLPLQYVWAAAAAYCDHEAGASQHFGHHSHQPHNGEQANAQPDDHAHPAKDHKPAKVHADCASCQFGHQATLPTASLAALPVARAAWPPAAVLLFTSYIADGPKRPDWTTPA